jgi:hypothetical protein
MESNKQEKYNLMHDNPVASHASWMSKHAQSSRMSPLNQNEDQMTIYNDRLNEKGETQEQVINKADSDANKAITDFNSLKFPTEEQYNKTKALSERTGYVRDSIGKANVKMDKLFAAQDQKRKEILSGKY